MKELAILFPSFNGGARLRNSVESCAEVGLPPDKYALIVVDNCSTDGSIEALPRVDRNNVPVCVYRNERNLGRAANWNRALEIAERHGFRFATFLFAGDTWKPASSISPNRKPLCWFTGVRRRLRLGLWCGWIRQKRAKSRRSAAAPYGGSLTRGTLLTSKEGSFFDFLGLA